jgi:hypothetical protein
MQPAANGTIRMSSTTPRVLANVELPRIEVRQDRQGPMKLCRYVLSITVAALIALSLRIAHASVAEGENDVVWLDPQHTNINFVLLGNLHDTHGRFTLRRGTIAVDAHNGNVSGEIVIDTTRGISEILDLQFSAGLLLDELSPAW